LNYGVDTATFRIVPQRFDHLRVPQYFPSSFPLHIAEVRQEALEEHSHEFFEMVYVRSGHGSHILDGTSHPICKGDFYVINPGETHGYAPAPESTLHIVNILWMPSLVEELLRADSHIFNSALKMLYVEPMLRCETRFAHRLNLSGRTAYRVEVLLDEMRREQMAAPPGCELLLRHLFCALLILLSRAHELQNVKSKPKGLATGISPTQVAVARAITYIEEHSTQRITVSDVAKHAALSPGRLAHVFKAQTGRGIIQYLHEFRIARACSLLLEEGIAVQDAASRAGYTDLRFFHRTFRRQTGCSPTQYKQHFSADSKAVGG
jgi:AraC-like DNA-binding protein